MALPHAITGSPYGTQEAPLPPVRGFFFLSLSIPVLPFFRRSMSPSLSVDDLCGGDVAKRSLGRVETCSEASSFRRNQPLSPLAGGCDACTGTLSLWSKPDLAQDQMLHRVHIRSRRN